MSLDEALLDVTWHQSVIYEQKEDPNGWFARLPAGGQWIASGQEGRIKKYVHPYSELFELSDQTLSEVEDQITTDGLYKTLAADEDIKWHRLKWLEQVKKVGQMIHFIPRDERQTVPNELFGDEISSSFFVLTASAVRRARSNPDHRQILNAEEWAEAAFEDRNRNPDPDESDDRWEDFFENSTGVEKPADQRRLLGHVANAILHVPKLRQPQPIAWRNQLTTFYVHTFTDI